MAPQIVVSGSFASFIEDVTLLDLESAHAFNADLQRFAAHVQRMTAALRSAAAQQPKAKKPKKRPLPPSLQHCSRETRLYLAERDGRRCFYCRTPFDGMRDATQDHYIPRSLWECNLPANLVLSCEPCNKAKDDKLTWSMAAALLAWAGREEAEGRETPFPEPSVAACS